jgi:hypothetical protein
MASHAEHMLQLFTFISVALITLAGGLAKVTSQSVYAAQTESDLKTVCWGVLVATHQPRLRLPDMTAR